MHQIDLSEEGGAPYEIDIRLTRNSEHLVPANATERNQQSKQDCDQKRHKCELNCDSNTSYQEGEILRDYV